MSKTPRVFIPQVAERYDEALGRRVPAFDFSPAAAFGQLITVLDPEDNPLMLARLTRKIRDALVDFDSERDYFLAVGDPGVIAVCAGLILRRNQSMTLLKWDRRLRLYQTMEVRP